MVKNKKDVSKINSENAEEICSQIREESSEEAESLLGKTHKERERLLLEASNEARARTQSILLAADKETADKKEKMLSAINMEKRRVDLEAKSLFASDVIAAVKIAAKDFRGSNDYARFFREAILEGIKIIDDKKAQVFYSHLDEGLVSGLNDLPAEFRKSDFSDTGVIVQSEDGRLLFDNRFSARLKRAYDEIYMTLLREA